jgi:endonuclease/exonuclease/phosphatase (EEP) superfamily protein YafD
VTILAWNLLFTNESYDAIVSTIRNSDADLVILSEINPLHREALRQLEGGYPTAAWQTRIDTRGIAMLSRIPNTQFVNHEFGASRIAAIEARLPAPGNPGTMSVLGIHTASPNLDGRTAVRDDQLRAIGDWARDFDQPLVIAGDFNITPWSPPFRMLLDETGLRDSREYFGYFASWPSDFGIFGIPIDHALVSPTLRVTDRAAGFPSVDSDHGWIRVTVTDASKR